VVVGRILGRAVFPTAAGFQHMADPADNLAASSTVTSGRGAIASVLSGVLGPKRFGAGDRKRLSTMWDRTWQAGIISPNLFRSRLTQ
jgi:hypothetical protein